MTTDTPTPRIPLARAEKIAHRVVDELRPFCAQIEIAGSIRRRLEQVGDIDIVILPVSKLGEQMQQLRARVLQNTNVITDGFSNLIVKMKDGTQLDIWIATPKEKTLFTELPCTFGTLLVCRTGSAKFNTWLATRAGQLGLHWNPYHGVFKDELLLASETEDQVFKALNLDFIKPEERER